MKFYTIKEEYIDYLKKIDNKVPDNYNGSRPYIGVLITINTHNYFAPLTSYKEKQDKIEDNKLSIFKLYEKDNKNNKLGMLNLNNMIPILESQTILLDLNNQNPTYKKILLKQMSYIKSKQDEIVDKANKLYKNVTVLKTEHFCKISCDFKLLEKHYKDFK